MNSIRTNLQTCLSKFKEQTVGVIGDLALDEFIHGRTRRISREAPVLILEHVGDEIWPGCAGNAARNVAALGAEVQLVGVVGRDSQGQRLVESLANCGVGNQGIVAHESATTWTKSRFLAGDLHTVRQQVMRLDREPRLGEPAAVADKLRNAITLMLDRVDAVLLCDYGGGVLAADMRRFALEQIQARHLPVIADSRYALSDFKGVTCATPNETEIEPIVGFSLENDQSVEKAGAILLKQLKAESLIITRGQLGLSCFSRAGVQHLPAFGKEARDVAGAGDTVAATVLLTLAAGGSVEEAARLANYAASRVVQQRGTAVTSVQAIQACMQDDSELG